MTNITHLNSKIESPACIATRIHIHVMDTGVISTLNYLYYSSKYKTPEQAYDESGVNSMHNRITFASIHFFNETVQVI